METTYIMLGFTAVNAAHTLINLFVTWSYKRKEDYAVVTRKNGSCDVVKIKTSKDHFKHRKTAYVVPLETHKFALVLARKRYFRYMEGNPEPFLWSSDEPVRIEGEVFHSIIENSGLKLLNTPPLGKNIILYLIIGGVILVGIMMFFGGGSGS
jgi:hypothetical protein